MQTSDGQPDVGSLKINVLTIINIIIKNAKKQKNIPSIDEIISGVVENAVIPSKAYLVNFQKDHFVSPATLWIFSYSNHFVLNPTNQINLLKIYYILLMKL